LCYKEKYGLKKILQFHIFRFSTDRLKEKNYKIEITPDQAKKNLEIISISDSLMIRTLFRITNREFSQGRLNDLISKKKNISKKRNSFENRKLISKFSDEIEKELFVPEIISLKIVDKRHYQKIVKIGGVTVNGKKYVPFIFSAGLIRRNSGLFIEFSLKEKMTEILNNGRDESVKIIPAKFNSYFGLYSSSTLPVSFPKICVVPDLVEVRKKVVDFGRYVGEGVDPIVEECEKEVEFNFFDGCGLVSPKMARKWSQDLELDYVGSTFGVRCSWLKGMCVAMDFHKFAKEEANNFIIKDVYGNDVDIRKVDVIVSTSMFKLYDSYSNTDEYIKKCEENFMDWGISKVNPKVEKNHCKTSYQFLQVLDIEKESQIEGLCKPTLDWISEVSGGSVQSSLLFALGEMSEFGKGWFDKLEPIYKALLLNNEMIKDGFLISHLNKSILKKKHDSKKGNLILNGNYQAIIPDPHLYCQHIFGMSLTPLLKDGESYSNYWNEMNVSDVAAIRSPIVHQSEVLHLKLRDDEKVRKHFEHIKSGIILPANGVTMDFALAGGADSDYDLIATINSSEILECRTGGLPILYDSEKPEKVTIDLNSEEKLIDAQMTGFGSRVGFFTNVSSTLYSLLYNFDEGSRERKDILNRLKWGRCIQGNEIDRQKGLIIPPFPEHWVKYKKILDDIDEEEKNRWEYNNRILSDKRPLFFIWLYDSYMRRYKKEKSLFNNISLTRYGITFEELLLLENKTAEQQNIIERYYKKTYFIDNQSPMNRISKYMEKELDKIQSIKNKESKDFDYSILLSKSFKTPLKNEIEKVKVLYKEYKSLKKSLRNPSSEHEETQYSTVSEIFRYINSKAHSAINSNSSDVSDIMVYCVYNVLGVQSKSFLWNCFGEEIVENIRSKKGEKFVRVPMPSKNGNIKYLWKKYGNFTVNITQE